MLHNVQLISVKFSYVIKKKKYIYINEIVFLAIACREVYNSVCVTIISVCKNIFLFLCPKTCLTNSKKLQKTAKMLFSIFLYIRDFGYKEETPPKTSACGDAKSMTWKSWGCEVSVCVRFGFCGR